MPYEISSLQKNAAPDEAVQSRGYTLIEHMGPDKFGKLVRDIRITRSLLLYDMAKTLDISPAELSAIECGKKPVPDWFIPALEKNYGIGDTCAHMLSVFAKNRGD
jgi:hypothetical protein